MKAPRIRTKVPGPKARAAIRRDEAVASPSYIKEHPLVAARGEGCAVEDVDGNRFLDFAAGIATVSTGHSHPAVVRAIERQARRFLHVCTTDFYDRGWTRLSERLARLAPGRERKRVHLGNSGAEGVETAIKLVRAHTKRPRLLAFEGAFHGRTLGALSLTSSKPVQRAGFGPLLPGVTHVPFGNCYRCPLNLTYPSCGVACVEGLRDTVLKTHTPPEEVAAVFLEPIQGEGGYVVPPPDYAKRLRRLCDDHGMLLVADEVQSGMGRTGRMLAIEHFGVVPDVIVLGKGIASGLPLSATVARASVMDWARGSHGSTFGGNPLSCAAGNATLDLLEGGLVENAARVGAHLRKGLEALADRHPLIGQVRGLGLMQAVELVRDRETKVPAKEETDAVVREAFARGLVLLTCGRSTIRFCPPLVVTRAECDRALEVLDGAFAAVGRRRKGGR